MSIVHQHFIIHGYEVPYGTFQYDDWEEDEKRFDYAPREQSVGDVVIISDGMGGDYCFVGVLQYKSDTSRRGMPTIKPQSLKEPTREQAVELHRVLWREFDVDPPEGDPEHYVLTHVT